MSSKTISFLLLTVLPVLSSFAQRTQRYTISGFMRDSLSTESLISATIYNKTNLAGATTNQYGFYSLTLPAGEVELVYSYVGYNTQTISFHLRRDTVININLTGVQYLQEVTVTGSRTSNIQERTQMSAVSMPIAQIKSLPMVFGEVDVMRSLQLMPGIQSGTTGSSGLHVRGGGPGENLILLDGVPLYNVSHIVDFVSIFNADAINNIEILKGGFPARYGGRISSVLDISLKEGNMKKFHGEVALGNTSPKFTFEGPIVKDKTSFIVSARRTLSDILYLLISMGLSEKKDSYETKFKMNMYFYDFTAKINHRFSDRNRIYLSAYLGNDKMFQEYTYILKQNRNRPYSTSDRSYIDFKWGTFLTSFRWNYVFTNRLFGNTMITYSRYRFNPLTITENKSTYFQSGSSSDVIHSFRNLNEMQNYLGIHDWSAKTSFDYLPSSNHYIRFGMNAIYHAYTPNAMFFNVIGERNDYVDNQYSKENKKLDFGVSKTYAYEYSAYIEDEIKLGERFKTNIGVHWSAFAVEEKFYNTAQPRISARLLISPQLSAKASYSQMVQYVHMVSNFSLGMAVDIFVPTTELLIPEKSEQVAFGLAHEFNNEYEISLEGYYKTLNNVVEFKDGANFLNMNERWDQQLVQGAGRSYGAEAFIQKKTGAVTGWIGYSLSWTDRLFDELNDGKRFPYTYDRRHDLSIAFTHRYERLNFKNKKKIIELSATWIFSSGYYVTVPAAAFDMRHPILPESDDTKWFRHYDYSERNNYRMPPSHRLDQSVAFIRNHKWGETRLVMSLFNAYFSRYISYMEVVKKRNDNYQFKETKLILANPAVSFLVKF